MSNFKNKQSYKKLYNFFTIIWVEHGYKQYLYKICFNLWHTYDTYSNFSLAFRNNYHTSEKTIFLVKLQSQIDLTAAWCPRRLLTSIHRLISHILTVLSWEPVTKVLSWRTIDHTAPSCPSNVFTHLPVCMFHICNQWQQSASDRTVVSNRYWNIIVFRT